MPTSNAPGIPAGFIVLFVIVASIAVGGAIWRAVVLSRGGLNPMVAKEQLEVRLAQSLKNAATSAPGQPAKTIEERLTELDDLYERGVISAEELAAGRAKVIGGDWALPVPAPGPWTTPLIPISGGETPAEGRGGVRPTGAQTLREILLPLVA